MKRRLLVGVLVLGLSAIPLSRAGAATPAIRSTSNVTLISDLDAAVGTSTLTRTASGISFTLQMEGHEAVVRIEDSGIGISPLEISTIFELFTQERSASERVPGGLGVGLAMVREIAELHGGSVQARSAGEGRGSEFTVRLPAVSPN